MTDIVSEESGALPGAMHDRAGPGSGSGTGRRTLTIARSALLLAAALVVCLAVMLAVGLQLMQGMDRVADGWRDYDLQAATRSDALSEVRGHLGLGGVIDHFREGAQAGTAGHAAGDHAALDRALALSRANLAIYRDIVTPGEDEARAIAAIAAFLNAIQVQMEDPAAAIPAEAFDACRRDAVKGLAALNSHLSAQRARLTGRHPDRHRGPATADGGRRRHRRAGPGVGRDRRVVHPQPHRRPARPSGGGRPPSGPPRSRPPVPGLGPAA
ncbi:hypothetical protein [Azospirillum sp. TSA6c]|uniref:hypothetical protein n=1 Tax=unclassified Azospirillum TaxID=2630922 RepID=UPI000D611FF9|nr:hypothetical protein [Azospirillum sp. TSA6c]PWC47336.1 hypothetical protein TSA6c_11855 [Azospirillum sp. TSA6c]PWC54050.1 hypothetical protein TSA6c_00935 [Azospirillum sp. TSA6c]